MLVQIFIIVGIQHIFLCRKKIIRIISYPTVAGRAEVSFQTGLRRRIEIMDLKRESSDPKSKQSKNEYAHANPDSASLFLGAH